MSKILNHLFICIVVLFLFSCSDYHKEVRLNKNNIYLHCISKGLRTTSEYIVLNNSSGFPNLADGSSNFLVLETDQILYQTFLDSINVYYNTSNSKVLLKNPNGKINSHPLDFRKYNSLIENYSQYKKDNNINYFGIRDESLILKNAR